MRSRNLVLCRVMITAMLVAGLCGSAMAQARVQFPTSGNALDDGSPYAAFPEYWLGVSCGDLDDGVRAQLKIDKESGVVVRSVLPNGPAAKAGIEKDDLLVAVGEKQLVHLTDLVEAVQAAKDTEIKLTLVRAGEKKEVAVTPAKRTAEVIHFAEQKFGPTPVPQGSLQIAPFNVRIFHPGQMYSGMTIAAPRYELPEGVTVTITKTGKTPATIRIQQGDKSFEATEDKLGDLPAEVRPHAEAMLGRFTLPLPNGSGDVLYYVPNAADSVQTFLVDKLRDAQIAGQDATRNRSDAAIEQAKKWLEQYQPSPTPGKAPAAEASARANSGATAKDAQKEPGGNPTTAYSLADVERANKVIENWERDKQFDAKFEAIERQLAELRELMKAMRDVRRAVEPAPPARAKLPPNAVDGDSD